VRDLADLVNEYMGERQDQKQFLKQLVRAVMGNHKQLLMQMMRKATKREGAGKEDDYLQKLKKNVSEAAFFNLAIESKKAYPRRSMRKEDLELRDREIQTEDFNFIDFDSLGVETGELYMFERKSKRMRKLVVEIDQEQSVKRIL